MTRIDLVSFRGNVPVSEQIFYHRADLNDLEALREQIRAEFTEGFADNWTATPIGGKWQYDIQFDGHKFVPTKSENKSVSEPIFNGNKFMTL